MVIPDTIEGVQVKNIADQAFQNRQKLVEVIILAKAITNLGNNVFESTRIRAINLPNSILTIGDRVFSQCRSLTNIKLPNTITTIQLEAFNRCSLLKNITIPASVTSIGLRAFEFCTKLTVKVLGTTPPTLNMFPSGVFGEAIGENTIHVKSIEVPSAALATYKAATGWREYTTGGSKPNLLTGY